MPVSERDLSLDRRLTEICGVVPLLRLVTPTNVTEARARFFAGEEPDFVYRPLPDLEAIRNDLDALAPEKADDAVIASMFEGLIREMRLRLEMLAQRETESFFLTAVEMFGHVEKDTVDLANQIIEMCPAEPSEADTIGAEQFAAAARRELESYRRDYPELNARIEVRPTTTGVLVETGDLYIGSDTRIGRSRVVPLLQHEVGTHIVTYENGRAQPLHMLALGLAHYDELQEALGVLAEYLVGGLPPSRLRVLAYRVIAARMRSENVPFRDTFRHLAKLGCTKRVAFTTVMRAYRSGGMTKDAIYLRGLMRLLGHLKDADDPDLTPLLVGKVSFETIPLVRELLDRQILSAPVIRPHYLDTDSSRERLGLIRGGMTVLDLAGVAA